MLSSQTKDENVFAAIKRLSSGLKGGLSAKSVNAASLAQLQAYLRGPPAVGFHNNKVSPWEAICNKL
jgi:endonuclease III